MCRTKECRYGTVVCSVVVCIWCVRNQVGGAEIEPAELKALNGRRAVKSAEVEINTEIKKRGDGDAVVLLRDRREIFLSNDRIRNDVVLPYDAAARQYGESFRVVTYESDGVVTRYSTEVDEAGRKRVVSIQPKSDDSVLIDPRFLGMFTSNALNLSNQSLESIVGRTDRVKSTTSVCERYGETCEMVEYMREDGRNVRLWISPSKGYSVVAIETSGGTEDDRKYVLRVESSVELDTRSGVWFPVEVQTEEVVNGATVESSVTSVRVKTLNANLDETVFSLAGLGLPKGQIVSRFGAGGLEQWDGESLVRPVRPSVPRVK